MCLCNPSIRTPYCGKPGCTPEEGERKRETGSPYLLVSDLHCHDWSQFSKVGEDGVNTRLRIILNELERAANELRLVGGNCIVIAGDLFHVRGKIAPEVFNPVDETIKRLTKANFKLYAIPGNHDLAGKETTQLGNAFQSLKSEDFHVITSADKFKPICFVPWCSTREELFKKIELLTELTPFKEDYDLVIHAGIDGVLSGVPASGLTSEKLASFGFRRVFAGHYHNHVDFKNGVYSIGATTHQQWGDIGTKAGFLLVWPDCVEFRASHAPSFVEVTGETDEDEIPLLVDGHYVRVRSMKLSDAEVQLFRKELIDMGAKGVSFNIVRDTVSARGPDDRAMPAATLDETVDQHVSKIEGLDPAVAAKVKAGCADVLATVRSVAA